MPVSVHSDQYRSNNEAPVRKKAHAMDKGEFVGDMGGRPPTYDTTQIELVLIPGLAHRCDIPSAEEERPQPGPSVRGFWSQTKDSAKITRSPLGERNWVPNWDLGLRKAKGDKA